MLSGLVGLLQQQHRQPEPPDRVLECSHTLCLQLSGSDLPCFNIWKHTGAALGVRAQSVWCCACFLFSLTTEFWTASKAECIPSTKLCSSERGALQRSPTSQPAAILMNMQLPKSSGGTTCKSTKGKLVTFLSFQTIVAWLPSLFMLLYI